ncbi:MAG: HU family DNA-binding protein [Muribaculaceae bacterium]|nr:HU family DNA-binding protein [Muribaculaceae bacterium]
MDNKTLIDMVSRRSGVNRKEATAMLAALSQAVLDAASQMDTIAIPSFGNFEPKKRLERIMAVPSTGRRLLLPPKISLTFRPAAAFKQQLRGTINSDEQ